MSPKVQQAAAALALAILEEVREEIKTAVKPAGLTPAQLRTKRGLQVRELAAKAHVARSTITRIELGKVKHLQPIVLRKIAKALNEKEETYMAAAFVVQKRSA